MVNLSRLTVKYIEKLASECNIDLKKSDKKDAKIKTVLKAGIPNSKLNELFRKYLAEYEASKKPKKVSKSVPTFPVKKIEGRVILLEKQVKFLMSKIDDFEIKIAHLKSPTMVETSGNLSEIKKIIISKISHGDSMLVDDLLDIRSLKKYSMTSIEKAVIELIDDEYFDVSEGSSKTKLEGNIGRLIRR